MECITNHIINGWKYFDDLYSKIAYTAVIDPPPCEVVTYRKVNRML